MRFLRSAIVPGWISKPGWSGAAPRKSSPLSCTATSLAFRNRGISSRLLDVGWMDQPCVSTARGAQRAGEMCTWARFDDSGGHRCPSGVSHARTADPEGLRGHVVTRVYFPTTRLAEHELWPARTG